MSTNVTLAGKTGKGCGAIIAIPFFAVFLAAGLWFEWAMVRDFWRTAQEYRWKETSCTILSSRVDDLDENEKRTQDYRVAVEYEYAHGGKTYRSERYQRSEKRLSDYGEAQRAADRFVPQQKGICYVNPASPWEAVLKRGSLWSGFGLLFPLIFVAIGGGGVYYTVRGLAKGGAGETALKGSEKPLSDQALPQKGQRALAIFFGFFLAMGSVGCYVLVLNPALHAFKSRSWLEVPCSIIGSEVRSHSDSEGGTTYSVHILYSYQVRGREHKSNRYHFFSGSSSGYERKAKIVARFPPGARAVCYVNPDDPTDAVIERGLTSAMFWGLIPLVFVGIGAAGLIYALRGKSSGTRSRYSTQGRPAEPASRVSVQDPTGTDLPETLSVPRVVRASAPPLTKLIGAVFVALFWNGIVSVFVWQAVQSWMRHRPEWFLTIFLIPFVAIGLVLIGAVVYFFLGLFNPRPSLTLNPGTVILGQPFEIKWEFSGRSHAISRLRVSLEGREEAQYRRGTSTMTDKSVFAALELANTTDRLALQSGQATLAIPRDSMHSWKGNHNKIVWAIQVHGEIERWPDVKEEFPLTVEAPPCTTRGPT